MSSLDKGYGEEREGRNGFSHQVLLVEDELLSIFVTTTSLGDPFSLEFLVQLGKDTKHLIQAF